MSNSRKGISAKLSNWMQKLKTTLSRRFSNDLKPLTYEEYHKRQQLSHISFPANSNRNGRSGSSGALVASSSPKKPKTPVRSAVLEFC